MGIGHMGLAFASKRVVPKVSLGLLLFAGLFLDAVWAIAMLLGLEHARIVPGITAASPLDLYDYPLSHSLVAALAWTVAFGGCYLALEKDRLGAAVLAVGVASHWFLDVASHRPDVPVMPAGPYVGLGLWNSVAATLVVEAALLLAGVAVYWRCTRSQDRIGSIGLAVLVTLFLVIHITGYLGPAPPNATALSLGTALLAVPLLGAHVVDRHRLPLP